MTPCQRVTQLLLVVNQPPPWSCNMLQSTPVRDPHLQRSLTNLEYQSTLQDLPGRKSEENLGMWA
jgi:hypothetical protein